MLKLSDTMFRRRALPGSKGFGKGNKLVKGWLLKIVRVASDLISTIDALERMSRLRLMVKSVRGHVLRVRRGR